MDDARSVGAGPCDNFKPDFVSIDCMCGHPINAHNSWTETTARTQKNQNQIAATG
jgi:hypothetical protein